LRRPAIDTWAMVQDLSRARRSTRSPAVASSPGFADAAMGYDAETTQRGSRGPPHRLRGEAIASNRAMLPEVGDRSPVC
jgi:hypothetical protein